MGPIQRVLLDSLKPKNYSKRNEDVTRTGPKEQNSKIDSLRSSAGKSKERKVIDEKQRSIIERIWGKQYSLEAKEIPVKVASPRTNANINSMAGNHAHQALKQPSSMATPAAGNGISIMQIGSAESHNTQQPGLPAQIHLSLGSVHPSG